MSKILRVPHRRQLADGYCLPACAQMVLAYWGLERDQAKLAHQLQMIPRVGTPAARVGLLASANIQVTYRNGDRADLMTALDQGVPPIVLVNTGQLPYWEIVIAHAVVLVGIEHDEVVLHDPGVSLASVRTPLSDFLLAWDEMANRYALIRKI